METKKGLSWILGAFFLMTALGAAVSSLISGLIVFSIALMILPPSREWLENRFEWMRFRTGVRIFIIIILLIIAANLDSEDDDSNITATKITESEDNTQSINEEATSVKEKSDVKVETQQSKKESEFIWNDIDGNSPKLSITVDKKYSTFVTEKYTAVIVPHSQKTYGHSVQTIQVPLCSMDPIHLTFCRHPASLKSAGFSDMDVDVYVLQGLYWSLRIPYEDEEPKFLSEMQDETKAVSVTMVSTYIPEIDDFGFVDIKYVSEAWCRDRSKLYSSTGTCEEAYSIFEEMIREKVSPNGE